MAKPFALVRWRFYAAFGQMAVIAAAYIAAWLLRFDFLIPRVELLNFEEGLLITLMVKMVIFSFMGLHMMRYWEHQGFPELIRLFEYNILTSFAASLAIFFVLGGEFPRSVYFLDFMVCLFLSGAVRFSVRLRREIRARLATPRDQRGILIYGGGVAGIALAREIRDNPKLRYKVIGFIDDDLRKIGARLAGIPVLGSGADAKRICEKQQADGNPVSEIVVAMPSASGKDIRAALARGKHTGTATRIVPGLGELISGKLAVRRMREISVSDLLGRDSVELDMEAVRRAIEGRSVLVTGAAGSIGSELCNQLAKFGPRQLIALDQAESELFRLEHDLRAKYPEINLIAQVGDIRDARHVELIIEQYAVNTICHAAAYKHVPIMQRQVCEAVRNNILGTWNLAQAAWRLNVSTFLMISTDKAVNPTSIMGLTKRIAELMFCAHRPELNPGHHTKIVCVRFGNVLVSNGSVVPIFQKQIAAGGPVTVTHPEMRRYFMTVQEAVQLVLQASTMGKKSEIFVLDMGKPVKIVDLAKDMITLAGFVPGEDIEIRYSGLRPGEKLFEEISLEGENIIPTAHAKIRVFQGHQMTFDQLAPWVANLQNILWRRDEEAILEHLQILVPEYQPYIVETKTAAGQSGLVGATLQRAFKAIS